MNEAEECQEDRSLKKSRGTDRFSDVFSKADLRHKFGGILEAFFTVFFESILKCQN